MLVILTNIVNSINSKALIILANRLILVTGLGLGGAAKSDGIDGNIFKMKITSSVYVIKNKSIISSSASIALTL